MECYVWDINSSVKRDSLGTLAEFISRGSLNRIYLNAMPITFFNNTLPLSLVLLVALSAFCSLLCFFFILPPGHTQKTYLEHCLPLWNQTPRPVLFVHFRGHREAIWSLVSKGHRLYSAGGDKVIKVWNMENVRQARCIELLEGHMGEVGDIKSTQEECIYLGFAELSKSHL